MDRRWKRNSVSLVQGRLKASAGPGAVPNVGPARPLQTCNQLTTPTNCEPQKLLNPLMWHCPGVLSDNRDASANLLSIIVITCDNFWRVVKGCRLCRGRSNLPFSIDKPMQSRLIHGWHYGQSVMCTVRDP